MLRQILPGSNRWTYTVFIPYKRDGSTFGGLDIWLSYVKIKYLLNIIDIFLPTVYHSGTDSDPLTLATDTTLAANCRHLDTDNP